MVKRDPARRKVKAQTRTRRGVQKLEAALAFSDGGNVPPRVPEPNTREWLQAHLAYLESELPKYEGTNPEAAARVKERIKQTKGKLKDLK